MRKFRSKTLLLILGVVVLAGCFKKQPSSSSTSEQSSKTSVVIPSSEPSSEPDVNTSVPDSSDEPSEEITDVSSVEIITEPVVSSYLRQKLTFSELGTLKVHYFTAPSETIAITINMISEIDIYTSEPQIVFVTHAHKSDYFIVELYEDVQDARRAALASLNEEYLKYNEGDYRNAIWLSLIDAYEAGVLAINEAKTIKAVNRALSVALSTMRTLPTRAEDPAITHPFMNNYGNYIVSPNDEGTVLNVRWNERPRSYASIATSMSYNLNHNFSAYGEYTITVENTADHPIAFAIQALSDHETNNSNSGESGHLLLAPFETRTVEIILTAEIITFHLFIDSSYDDMNDAHSQGGSLILSAFGFVQTGEIVGANAHLYTQYDQNDYVIKNKPGVDANITYENIRPNSYWPRVVREIEMNVGEKIVITIRNNGTNAVSIGLHAGIYTDSRSDASNNHFFPLWKNNGIVNNYFSDGETYIVAPGASVAKTITVDQSDEHGVNHLVDTIDCIQLLIDNGIHSETALRSGNIDIVAVEII